MRIFRTALMAVVDGLPVRIDPADLQGKEADRLLLTWEQRRWLRGRFTTEMGRMVGIALPTGTQIESGQILWIGAEWYLTMEAAVESLLVIQPEDQQQAILTAFEIGNLHFPLALDAHGILVQDDSAMVQLLKRIGVRWERRRAAFQPAGKARPHEA